jgi:(p)ppGpp synthase/HD superfamily hydrolase
MTGAVTTKEANLDPTLARDIARRAHAGQVDRRGEPLIGHVERVAEAVPAQFRAIAFLHDVRERTEIGLADLQARGLSEFEGKVLELLTRRTNEPYAAYVERVADTQGRTGRVARVIKLADLNDHLEREVMPGAPDYAWARSKIRNARAVRPGADSRRVVAAA